MAYQMLVTVTTLQQWRSQEFATGGA